LTVKKKTKAGSTPKNKTLKLRLPKELKDAVIEQAHVKGDLARIILFALRNVDRGSIPVQATKKVTELTLSTPTQANIGAKALAALKEWADEEDVSVNSLMIHVLTVFFRALKRNKSLRDELKLELRTTRGLPIPD
jgi:hypothetical protein